MATNALASTVVTGAVLLALLVVVLRAREWQAPGDRPGEGLASRLEAANGPLGWSVGFFVVAFGLTTVAVAYVSGASVGALDQAGLGLLLAVSMATVFGLAALGGVYAAVRGRGLNSAQAAGVSSALLGALFLLAIVVQLFVGG